MKSCHDEWLFDRNTNNLKTFEMLHSFVSKTRHPTSYIKPTLSLHAFLNGIAIYMSGRFAMPVTCEIWPSLINSCNYDARQTCEIYQVTQKISKLCGIRPWLVNVVLCGIKDMWTSEMTVKLKSNLYIGPVNIFPNLWHCTWQQQLTRTTW